ncbi:MAG TPA: hypothetical protein DCL73_09740 [Treponema sp.]|nr:hypothetical protein [Treponema sp.]
MTTLFGSALVSALLLTAALAVVVSCIVYKITRPFDKVIKRVKSGGPDASPEEISASLWCYKRLTILTVAANLIGFVFGQIAMVILGLIRDGTEFSLSRVLLVVGQAFGFGYISAITTIYGINIKLAPMRGMLKVQSLDEHKKQRGSDVTAVLAVVFFGVLYFMAINMLTVPYGIFFAIDKGAVPGTALVPLFLKKGTLAAVLSAAFCILPVRYVFKGLRGRISETAGLVDDIAKKGDLRSRINITMIDDFGMLTASINRLMNQFASIVSGIKRDTSAVAGSAETISSAVTEASSAIDDMTASFNNINDMSSEQEKLISHADENIKNLVSDAETVKKHVLEQASAIQQTSASISEMSANIASVAEMAHKAAGVSEALSATSGQGNEAVSRAVTSMNEIQKSSAQVQEMVHVIQQVAAQTNLLAMNAAIEAAHAGEFGRGFAVVADEVRSLSTSSAKSTHEIQQYIKDMIGKIDAGAEAIGSAGASFRDISGRVTENGELVRTISNAMEEQRTGAEETMKSTGEVVGAIEAIKDLAEKESVNAESVRDFMQNVVKASRTTVSAVSDSIFAAANLQDAVSKVDSSAADNKETVGRMEKIVNGFII